MTNDITTIQDKFASALDRRQVCSFDIEFVDNQTSPLIHSAARFLYFLEGKCTLLLNGIDYEIVSNTLVAIMPWDITLIKDVKEPLTFQKIVYNSDFINGYLRTIYNPKNIVINLHETIKENPVLYCDHDMHHRFQTFIERLQMELGDDSLNPDYAKLPELSDAYVTSMLVGILVLFNRFCHKTNEIKKMSSNEVEITNQILKYISTHLQSKITLDKLSKIFYISESTIAKYLQENIGYSFSEMLTEIRISKSYDLLLYSDLSLNIIAQLIGYTDASHFIKAFTTKVGCTPNEYRKSYQTDEEVLKRKENEVIYKVLNYIDENYLSDKISGAIVSKKFGITMMELNHIMVFQVEKTFDDYVDWLRISRASELLISTDLAITDIAIEVGYNTTKTFTRIFTNIRKMTPGAFRKTVSLQKKNGEIIPAKKEKSSTLRET
ncbi:helix-turn-helix domain-containing protein [Anaerorhabdus furcosa]|uniref:AraC-type DNA-binding protein n=1 Tax=Anaerorhabdus furcosa TaxID=118967 RepID=A0A1T4NVS7_9FIRM|nr:AraC family transcriptional regulator [Anaerorhabdus furcosa]SJZ83333.1 AraC-type DNA-binding protein [Anaerorhabdus furcosa]